jgi:integrase
VWRADRGVLSIHPKAGIRRVYRSAPRTFLDFVYGRLREDCVRSAPAAEVAGLYEDLADDRDRAADLIRFAGTSTDAPTTTRTRAAAVLEFLAHHGIDLSDRDRRRIRGKVPRGGAVTRRGDLTHEMLRRIAGHMDEHTRALVLVLASSGMRIGEAVTVRLADLDLETVPASIEIRPEHSRNRFGRVTFISAEAASEVRTWLAVRDGYHRAAVGRASGCVAAKDPVDPRLFPFSITTAEDARARALAKADPAERDERTRRLIRPLHSLRAFFASQLGLSCPQQVVEELLGHEGYLTDACRRYSRQQLAEAYLAAEHHVTVLVPAEYKVLKNQVADRLQAHPEILESVVLENVQLKGRVQQLESQNATILEAAGVLKEISEHPRLQQALRESVLERE